MLAHVFLLSCQNKNFMQLNKICQKVWKFGENLTNSSERELYGLQYIGGYVKKIKNWKS